MNDEKGAPVAVGLGSNLGDREEMLRLGLAGVRRLLDEIEVSGVYKTAPRHVVDQPHYLNACCVGRTRLTARQVLSQLKDVERLAGREAGGLRYGPRRLDLDLLLYDGVVLDEPDLIVPHPRMHERAFVLVPLTEIAPDWTVPARGGRRAKTVAALALTIRDVGITRIDVDLS